ncbi:MAG TPA: hypothetical protein VFZ82_16870 [Methylomirabilota bacterium]|nr:hypothetical protein [Methylomirabilota bacterium]
MRRPVTALLAVILIGALAPLAASAQDIRVGPGMRPDAPGTGRPPSHRPRPPFGHRRAFFPCCVGWSYLGTEPPPPVVVMPPPPIVYVVPASPTLAYVAPARVEPAPEIQLATGRWERHGNGKEYPYTWVWVGASGSP